MRNAVVKYISLFEIAAVGAEANLIVSSTGMQIENTVKDYISLFWTFLVHFRADINCQFFGGMIMMAP